ncbi:MAG: hypothetical protein ACO2ZA_07810 [Litorivicinaceae bacterium]|jgi:hypothetical protein
MSGLKLLMTTIASISFMSLAAYSQDAIQSPDDWFRDYYASHWDENVFKNLEAIVAVLDETVYYHPPSENVEELDGRRWMTQILKDYKDAGFQGSELVQFKSEQLNNTTATFKTRWIDRFADGSEVTECWWYMADTKNDRWVITQFALIDCQEHAL